MIPLLLFDVSNGLEPNGYSMHLLHLQFPKYGKEIGHLVIDHAELHAIRCRLEV